jgi:arginase
MSLDPLRCESLNSGDVAVFGIPWDEHSSYLRGPAQAPARIREALHCGSSNLCTENRVDLGRADARFSDLGDLDPFSGRQMLAQIETAAAMLLQRQVRPLALGGDHTVTWPLVRPHGRAHENLTLVHFDAHPDLYDEFEGNRMAHACPFARIMESGLVHRLVQVGIRTLNPHQQSQVERFGVDVLEMKDAPWTLPANIRGPVYLSLDLDVLDPAFAPGVSHHEPGGLSTRELLRLIHSIRAPVVGADIVEYNPLRDQNGLTAMVAAKCLKEIAGKMMGPSHVGSL